MKRARRLGLLLALAAGAALAQLREGQTVVGFRFPEYDKDGALKTLITGDSAKALSPTLFDIRNLKIEMFKDGAVDTRVTAPQCRFDRRAMQAASEDSVRIVRGDLVITGEGFTWSGAPSSFRIERNAKVVLRNIRPETLRREDRP